MNRIKLSVALMAAVCSTLGAASAARAEATASVQANWAAQKKFVQLPNGIRMAYVELGNPKGEPLLLLHGYTDSSRSWSLSAPFLANYRLLIPDHRGHGATTVPECCFAVSDFAYDAKLFLNALGVERAAIVGHSLGSMVAMKMAAEYPQRVSRIVLVGSTAKVAVKRGEWLYDNAMALKAPIDPTSQFMRDWHPANQPTPVDPVFAEAVRQEYMTIPLHVWHSVIRELDSVPLGRHAADIKIPVLVISGGKDPLFPPDHHAALLAAFPQAKGRAFPELGHNPNWEQPKEIARAIAEFLAATR